MVILLILTFIGIAFFEVPGLVRERHWRELAAFASFYLVAFVMTLLQTLGILKPGLMTGVDYLMKEVLHIYYK